MSLHQPQTQLRSHGGTGQRKDTKEKGEGRALCGLCQSVVAGWKELEGVNTKRREDLFREPQGRITGKS